MIVIACLMFENFTDLSKSEMFALTDDPSCGNDRL